jgi:16S rRNA (cytosine967-C5)-methyltransferase
MATGQSGPTAEGGAVLAARRGALGLLDAVLRHRRLMSDALGDLAGLAPADRARAQRLATATLRRIGPIDAALAPLMARPPDAGVRNLLRLAVTELSARPAEAHGIVGAAVDLARAADHAHAAGFVNAVLRKLATGADPLAGAPPQRLPRWLRDPLRARFGKAAVARIEAVQAADPPLDLTPRDPAEAAGLAALLGAALLPTGSLRLTGPVQVTALPGHAEGRWWVQDAAAALPARVLDPARGARVLDLCAAPGGKTLQLAAAGAAVTALDVSAARMARLAENLARCGLRADCVTADALTWENPGRAFDAILLDAPCSASGTIRRHPDLPFVKSASDLPPLLALQAALLDRAVALLRPGGRLVYCTCSLLPEEGPAQIEAALARHPGLARDPWLPPGVPAAWQAEGALVTRPDLWPERGGLDGFFVARLRLG